MSILEARSVVVAMVQTEFWWEEEKEELIRLFKRRLKLTCNKYNKSFYFRGSKWEVGERVGRENVGSTMTFCQKK